MQRNGINGQPPVSLRRLLANVTLRICSIKIADRSILETGWIDPSPTIFRVFLGQLPNVTLPRREESLGVDKFDNGMEINFVYVQIQYNGIVANASLYLSHIFRLENVFHGAKYRAQLRAIHPIKTEAKSKSY